MQLILAWRLMKCKPGFCSTRYKACRYTADMDESTDQPVPAQIPHQWLQFRLRSLLILVAVISIACACVSSYVQHQFARYEAEWHEEDAIINRIDDLFYHPRPGSMMQVQRAPHGPAWLRALAPRDIKWIFGRVELVSVPTHFATSRDDTPQLVCELKKLKFLLKVDANGSWHRGDFREILDFTILQRALPNATVTQISSL